jgi:hypothetical protein
MAPLPQPPDRRRHWRVTVTAPPSDMGEAKPGSGNGGRSARAEQLGGPA